MYNHTKNSGFSIIEFSILLLLMAFIIGGALVGGDLMHASHMRDTMAQLQQYQTGVARFTQKYAALPGDMDAKTATKFGFTARGSGPAQGDGDHVIEGVGKDGYSGIDQTTGETAMFWVDLTSANGQNINFIEGHFETASPSRYPDINPTSGINDESRPDLKSYLPVAKIGNDNFIYVWSDRNYKKEYLHSLHPDAPPPTDIPAPVNYFGISQVNGIGGLGTRTAPGLTTAEAEVFDKKIDDGFPTTGIVTAQFINARNFSWAGNYGGPFPADGKQAIPATPATLSGCYDNNNVAGARLTYSLDENGGGLYCAISLKMGNIQP
jgi:hypothetical protein